MAKAQRDYGLDILKGIACVAMIFAHVSAYGSPWVHSFRYWGAFAPVLFYGVTGVTTEFQLKKRRPSGLIAAYAALALLGYLNSWIWNPGEWLANIMQCIGLSVIALIVLRRWFDIKWFGILFPLPFLLHWLVMATGWHAPYPLSPFVLTPGLFALAPWLSFFMLGSWAYRARLRVLAGLAGLSWAAALGMRLDGFNMTAKFAMTPGYFVLSCALLVTAMLAIRAIPALRARGLTECAPRTSIGSARGMLIYFGRNSLLFLFVHLFAGRALIGSLGLEKHAAVEWSGTLALTLLLMMGILWLQRAVMAPWRLGERPRFWLGLMLAGTLAAYSGEVLLLYPLGFLFATHYLVLVRKLGAVDWASLLSPRTALGLSASR